MARSFMALVAAAATIFSIGSPPQVAGAAPCPDIITSLVDCLTYVEVGASFKRPSAACCSSIAHLLDAVPMPCICQVMETAKETGFAVNMTKALNLPSACSLKAPSLHCQAPSPSPSPSSSPSTPISPSPSQSPSSSPPSSRSQSPLPSAPQSSAAIVTPAPSPAQNLNAAPALAYAAKLVALLVATGSALFLAH